MTSTPAHPDSPPRADRWTVAVDVGGSFTDVVAWMPSGDAVTTKVPSTPDDPSRALMDGILEVARSNGLDPARLSLLLHGTTVATNSVLQRRGAVTALVTTEGFRDVLQIARQARPRLFDLDGRRPEPLVPRSLRREVRERTLASGEELVPVDEASIRAAAEFFRERGVEAVAIVFLHSYMAPKHERMAMESLSSLLPGVHISCSSDVLREYREYERTSTTVVNAFVAPLMERYIGSISKSVANVAPGSQVRLMQSNGGLMTLARAARLPAATVMSGIAAGAIAGAAIGAVAADGSVVTLDMGGTSADIAVAVDGHIRAVRTHHLDGLPVGLPALDVHTIGAGGGSIAYLDAGSLRVGPRSAGARPGPAAYGHGAREPTVTDANLILGRLPEAGLLGGRVPLRRGLAEQAIASIAEPMGISIVDAAEGVLRIVNATMARQIRVLTVERGTDPRSCELVAFGGAGPLHAADLARELGTKRVLIPPTPGLTSAVGLLLSDLRVDAVQTAMVEIVPAVTPEPRVLRQLSDLFGRTETDALADIPAGIDSKPTLRREVEARYRRQGHELRIAVPDGVIDAQFVVRLLDGFGAAHRMRYGYEAPNEPVVIVNVLVTASLPQVLFANEYTHLTLSPDDRTARRAVVFDGVVHDTPILERASLTIGGRINGPAVIEQYDATTVVPPWASVTLENQGHLVLEC